MEPSTKNIELLSNMMTHWHRKRHISEYAEHETTSVREESLKETRLFLRELERKLVLSSPEPFQKLREAIHHLNLLSTTLVCVSVYVSGYHILLKPTVPYGISCTKPGIYFHPSERIKESSRNSRIDSIHAILTKRNKTKLLKEFEMRKRFSQELNNVYLDRLVEQLMENCWNTIVETVNTLNECIQKQLNFTG